MRSIIRLTAVVSMRRQTTFLLVAAITSLLLLASATPASANTTKVTWVYDNFTSTIRDWCDFPVKFTAVGPYKQTDFYDDAGTLYKTTLRPGGGQYVYTVSANGKTLETTSGYSATLTYNSDGSVATSTLTGVVFHFTVPGEGVVLLNAGKFAFDLNTHKVIFQAGPNQDYTELCAALD